MPPKVPPQAVPGTFSTTSLGVAAYVKTRGLPILDLSRSGGGPTWIFSDPEGRGTKLSIEFENSPEHKYDEAVRSMKRLAFGDRKRD